MTASQTLLFCFYPLKLNSSSRLRIRCLGESEHLLAISSASSFLISDPSYYISLPSEVHLILSHLLCIFLCSGVSCPQHLACLPNKTCFCRHAICSCDGSSFSKLGGCFVHGRASGNWWCLLPHRLLCRPPTTKALLITPNKAF